MSDHEPQVRPLTPVDLDEHTVSQGESAAPTADPSSASSEAVPAEAPNGGLSLGPAPAGPPPAPRRTERVGLAAALAVFLSASSNAAIGGLVMVSVDTLAPAPPPVTIRSSAEVESAAPIVVPEGKADRRAGRKDRPAEQAAEAVAEPGPGQGGGGEDDDGAPRNDDDENDKGGTGTTVPPAPPPPPSPSPATEEDDGEAPPDEEKPEKAHPPAKDKPGNGLGLGHIKAKGQGHHKDHGHGHDKDEG